mmetsp:Transcript_10223/g.25688  ORF Transcript_10223/g.25688 Transcript_10223/m.25688 type:complete len:270 (-) Transcript_10223:226-1035(-)
MQSWSHLVRVRHAWDEHMKDNPEIEWLALVDDDTFVFPDTVQWYLSRYKSADLVWGGLLEYVRVDNGDAGNFAKWLREYLHMNGADCTLPDEEPKKDIKNCSDTMCIKCPPIPQGAAIFLSRALVETLRPHTEDCETMTQTLCKRCGSQRLYMCIHRHAKSVKTEFFRGIHRNPMHLEEKHHEFSDRSGLPLTWHGFGQVNSTYSHTRSFYGDFLELWRLSHKARVMFESGERETPFVHDMDVANRVMCNGLGVWRINDGRCTPVEDLL